MDIPKKKGGLLIWENEVYGKFGHFVHNGCRLKVGIFWCLPSSTLVVEIMLLVLVNPSSFSSPEQL